MALDLGTISGVIGLDDSPLNSTLDRALGMLKKWAGDASKEGEKGGEEGGKKFAEGWGKKALLLLGTGGAAVASAFTAAVVKGMNLEPAHDKVAATLGLTVEEADRAAQAAGKLYSSNWGDSMEDAANRTGIILSSLQDLRGASADEIARMSGLFSAFADGYEVDLARATQVTGQMVTTGLAANAEEGLDLLTKAFQKVPAAVREDVLDAADEYGPFFAQLGITGDQAMGMLVQASEKGMFGIDKLGDGLKEFTIRATDMSTATGDAYKTLGLNQHNMTNDLLAGGDTASAAFGKIIGKLREITDPAKQAETALALFGTPLEDLNTGEIPAFLDQMAAMDSGLGDVSGATQQMADTMSGNASSNIKTFLRSLETGATEVIGGQVLPALNDVTGMLIQDWGPALSEGSRLLSEFGRWVQDNATWLGPLATGIAIFGGALAALGLVGYISSLGGMGAALGLLSGQLGITTAALMAKNAAMLVVSGASKVFAAAQWLVNAALSANPIGLVVLALAGLVTAFVLAYQNSEEFRAIVDGALQAVKAGAEAVVNWFNNDFLPFWSGIFGGAGEAIDEFASGADQAMRDASKWVDDQAKAAGDALNSFASGADKAMEDAAKWVDDGAKTLGRNVLNGLEDARRWGQEKLDGLRDGAGRVWGQMESGFKLWSGAFGKLLSGDFEGFQQDAEKILGNMKDNLLKVFDGIKDGAKRIWDMLPDDLKAPIRDAVKWINETFIDGINGMLGKLSISFRVPTIPGFADGGYTGAGGKYVPRGVVHAGEVVWSQDDVAAWGGPEAVDRMRRSRSNALDPFYDGGIVGGGGLAAYQESVRRVAKIVSELFRVPVPYSGPQGRPQQGRFGYVSDHPRGMAFDVMMPTLHNPLGYAINSWMHKNANAIALKYTVWDGYSYPLRLGGRPGNALNRGDATNNHYDHVHASFQDRIAPLAGLGGADGFDFGIGALISNLLKQMPGIASPWGEVVVEALGKIPEGIGQAIFKSMGFSMGTDYANPGIAAVAENGAELVLGKQLRNFQGGERVLNPRQTVEALSGGSNCHCPSTIVVVDVDGALVGRMRTEARDTVHSTVETARRLR